jgi:hypothetical protein
MAGKVNFKINQGETFKHTLTWKDSSEVPIDVTGFSARMQVRLKIDATDVLILFSSEPTDNPDGTITLGGVDGTFSLYLSADFTETITWLAAVYDLEVVDTLGDVTRLIEGKITVSKEVTR